MHANHVFAHSSYRFCGWKVPVCPIKGRSLMTGSWEFPWWVAVNVYKTEKFFYTFSLSCNETVKTIKMMLSTNSKAIHKENINSHFNLLVSIVLHLVFSKKVEKYIYTDSFQGFPILLYLCRISITHSHSVVTIVTENWLLVKNTVTQFLQYSGICT